MIYFKNTKLFM